MDADIRRLETALAATPDDLDIRQRLLSGYLRSGLLRQNDIADLAALGDAGAEGLLGRKVDLQSRSKRFYLRCAWVVTKIVLERFQPPNEVLKALAKEDKELADRIIHSVEVLSGLMEDYLSGHATAKTERPYKYFRKDSGVSLGNFRILLRDLRDSFQRTATYHSNTNPDPRCFYDILEMTRLITEAIKGNVKRDTDSVLKGAADVINLLRGTPFTGMASADRDDVNRLLWQELVDQGAIQTIPQPIINQGWARHDYETYLTLASRQLLRTYRSQIINHWLPNYTP